MSETGTDEDPSQHIKEEAADYHASVVTDPHSTPEQVDQSAGALESIVRDSGDAGFLQRTIRRVMKFGQGRKTIEQIKSGN